MHVAQVFVNKDFEVELHTYDVGVLLLELEVQYTRVDGTILTMRYRQMFNIGATHAQLNEITMLVGGN
eukprot:CAMPEP_0116913164 /NCGR_PEP_ID=MMETSP0467-20121206/16535_1 /TAXON_ID=283647 /ORGANISM="Mesodinium pulex, Strain SPMC105" /LENGTH=67 /DNA_ID=CAMNT_0004589315 /DNA_START=2086 /DNA_END=2289 /DNA_ORIENTATION=+